MPVQLVRPDEVLLVQLLRGDTDIKKRVRNDPGTALTALGSLYGEAQLPVSMQARVLEEIIVLVNDPNEARELLASHLTPEATAEMIAVMGDRLSAVSQIVDFNVLVAALEMDVGIKDSTSALEPSLLIRAWAMNLKDRPDWEEELDYEIGSYTLRELLVSAVFYEEGQEKLHVITPDSWMAVGLDPDEADELLRRLIERDELPEFDELSIAQARKNLRERTQRFEEETSSSSIGKIVEDLDI